MLSVRNVYKTFNPGTVNEVRALRGVSLDLPEGAFLVILGGNGSGKSTLLNAVAGGENGIRAGLSPRMTRAALNAVSRPATSQIVVNLKNAQQCRLSIPAALLRAAQSLTDDTPR
jgi:ABC-type uncharacterized transport system ATPase component